MADILKDLIPESGVLNEENVKQLAEAIRDELTRQKIELTAELDAQFQEALKEAVEISNERVEALVEVAVNSVLDENAERFQNAERFDRVAAAFAALEESLNGLGFELNPNQLTEAHKEEVEAASRQYANLLESHVDLKAELKEVKEELELAKRAIIFEHATRELPMTVVESLGNLVENVRFDSSEEFCKGLKIMIEQVKISEKPKSDNLNEEDEKVDPVESDAEILKRIKGMKLHEMNHQERVVHYRAHK